MKEEVFIPSPLAEQLEEAAEGQGVTADEIAENAIRNYIRSDSNV
ncbi:MAG: CopG family transcriptional regulator [Ruminococcus sp.]|nr:CopG family transcriptional regulator [Ruminococcus sp.]